MRNQLNEYKVQLGIYHFKIEGMNQVLGATGAGDLAKELAVTQEKLSNVQCQLFEVKPNFVTSTRIEHYKIYKFI